MDRQGMQRDELSVDANECPSTIGIVKFGGYRLYEGIYQ